MLYGGMMDQEPNDQKDATIHFLEKTIEDLKSSLRDKCHELRIVREQAERDLRVVIDTLKNDCC